MSNKIVTVTLNPCIDKSSSIERFQPDVKMRCNKLKAEAGGGGINVSKALRELECDSLAIVPLGGPNGELMKELLMHELVIFHQIKTGENTREAFIVTETSTNHQFRFNFPGEEINEKILEEVMKAIEKEKPEIMVASGSLPDGLPENSYAQLASFAKEKNIKFILDTSGPALKAAAHVGVYLLKPNIAEMSKLLGVEKLELEEVDEAAQELIKKNYAEVIAVSLGAQGALLATKKDFEHIPAPNVKKQSTVGAGDSMVAGMVYMLSQDKPLKEVIRFGVACGTAATMNPGTELFKKQDVERLYSWLQKK